ncbi:hypothetical protein DPMN_150979 [Dreissena polymorpha]|uniref:Uncharacterized protein n=1 Tax=Dreissena polymorpha TaxID=45954 RepID=A0A9D4FGQ6_DREPO|nr:hypothetical protein DPMN_150979 [Dreissena polymorpha]
MLGQVFKSCRLMILVQDRCLSIFDYLAVTDIKSTLPKNHLETEGEKSIPKLELVGHLPGSST